MRRTTLRTRLILIVSALAILVIASSSLISAIGLRNSMIRDLDEDLARAARFSFNTSEGGFHGTPSETPRPTSEAPGPTSEDPGPTSETSRPGEGIPPDPPLAPGNPIGTLWYLDTGGEEASGLITAEFEVTELERAQMDVLGSLEPAPEPMSTTLPGIGNYRVLVSVQGDEFRVFGMPLSPVDETVTNYAMRQGLVGLGGVAATALLAAWLIRRELRPLREVADTARSVAALPLDHGAVSLPQRVTHEDPTTEVGQVGGALNTLLGHVESSLAARHRSETQVRQFVADASHELRTPLASITGYTELIRRREDLPQAEMEHALDRISQESARMNGLVEDMLLLARLDAGRPLVRGDVDLASLAADTVMDAAVRAPDHAWHLDLPTDSEGDLFIDGLTVTGDEARLRQVIGNLIRNAQVHTPPGTTTTLAVRAVVEGVEVTVSDDGPGIPPEVAATVFDRFVRGDTSRRRSSGTSGLGLSIARSVVEAHGGTITLDSASDTDDFVPGAGDTAPSVDEVTPGAGDTAPSVDEVTPGAGDRAPYRDGTARGVGARFVIRLPH